MIKFMIELISKPKHAIYSDKFDKYNFSKMNFLYLILFFLIALAKVKIDIYSNKEFFPTVFIFQTFLQVIIMYLYIYLQIFVIHIYAKLINGNCCNFYELRRHIFPFFALVTTIRCLLTILLQLFNIDAGICMLAVNVIPKLYMVYPIYLVLNKFAFPRKGIYGFLIVYTLLIMLNFF